MVYTVVSQYSSPTPNLSLHEHVYTDTGTQMRLPQELDMLHARDSL